MEQFEQIMAKRREAHEAKMKELQLKEAEINKERNRLKREYHAGNRALNDALNKPTVHSVASHRKIDAHNIKRMLGKQLASFETQYLDTENAGIGFEIKDDCIQFGITVPFKQHNAEIIG